MIPKIIHYCWFGNKEKDSFTIECINTWKEKCPDYKIIEWNETNCDLSNVPQYIKSAYKCKQWAFVSDYFRLQKLIEFGGIYLDTDVKLLNDFVSFLNLDFFISFESPNALCTAVIGAKKGEEILKKFINIYHSLELGSKIPNSKLLFDFLKLKDVNIDNNLNISENKIIFKQAVFSPLNYYTKENKTSNETISIHYYGGTWKTKKEIIFDNFKRILYKILGEKKYNKIRGKFKNEKK